MPEDKRTFETQTFNIQSIHPQKKLNKGSVLTKKKTNKLNDPSTSLSKDIIMRLIDWLEKE